jgi:hypothetical protein
MQEIPLGERDAGIEQQGLEALQAELLVIHFLQMREKSSTGIAERAFPFADGELHIITTGFFGQGGQKRLHPGTADGDRVGSHPTLEQAADRTDD